MKKLIALFLCCILLLSLPIPAFAEGEGNLDGGGGSGIGGAIGGSKWSAGHEGVRVTIVRVNDNKPIKSVDLSRYEESKLVDYHFAYKNKLYYKSGNGLSLSTNKYKSIVPKTDWVKIISENGGNANIQEIKNFFTDRQVLKRIAEACDIDYNTLINGKYKLLLEPIAYLTYKGNYMAITATEAALYDRIVGGRLSYDMHSLTRKNLPLAMFLESADLGFPKYTGKKNLENTNSTIISCMGLGIVKFNGQTSTEPEGDDKQEYRVNTDVITSVMLHSDSAITPDKTATVTFRVLGSSYRVTNIVVPNDGEQIVWMKWHTPNKPQTIKISVSTSRGSLSANTITVRTVDLNGHEPPDPTAKDRNDGFKLPDIPKHAAVSSNSWGVWSAKWITHMVKHTKRVKGSDGHYKTKTYWKDEGWWKYTRKTYRAVLSARMDTLPDDKVPTAKGKEMKSGYGVKIDVTGKVNTNAALSATTAAQTAVAYFPEFQYQTYWRVLDLSKTNLASRLQFKVNKYSTYGRRVHFTPLWYPDGPYKTYTYLQDAWTPAGMLSANLSDTITIDGNVYQDWHIGPKMNK